MKIHVRLLLAAAAVALAAGWIALRHGNSTIEARLAAGPAQAEVAR